MQRTNSICICSYMRTFCGILTVGEIPTVSVLHKDRYLTHFTASYNFPAADMIDSFLDASVETTVSLLAFIIF